MRRINASWTPTPIVAKRSELSVRVSEPPTAGRKRAMLVMICTLVWMKLKRRTPAEFGRYVYGWLKTRGMVYGKVAQVLSMRGDLFSSEFCAQFVGAQTRALAISTPEARLSLARELPNARLVFTRPIRDPKFAATMGTIFRARLRKERRDVAVKLQPLFLMESFTADIRLLRWVAWFVSYIVPRWRLDEGVQQVEQMLAEEIDFRFEANAQIRCRREFRKHGLYVPQVYAAYCTAKLLVTEWVSSVPMTEFLTLLETAPAKARRWCRVNGIDPEQSAWTLLMSLFRQIFEANRVHVDMHPGNLGLLRNGLTVVFDFGSTCRVEREFLDTFFDQIRAMASGHFAWAADLCLLMSAELPRKSWWITRWRFARRNADMKQALKRAMQSWSTRTEIATLDYHQKSLNACSLTLMKTVMRAGGAMQWEWLRLSRAMMTLDTTVAKLFPTLNYPRLVRSYLEAAQDRLPYWAPIRALARLYSRIPQFAELVDRLPEFVRLKDQELRTLAMPFLG